MTLKQVAEKYVDSFEYSIAHPRRVVIKSFLNGAKWQKEQQDKFAIEILEYYHNGLFFVPLKEGEAKKILEHIKQIKGL